MLSRPMFDRIAFLGISWYAILIVSSILIGYVISSREARKLGLHHDTLIDLLLYGIPLAILGARLYYVIFRFNHYSEDILSIFNIREGGLAIYGGVIGGILAARITAKKYSISPLTLLDIVAPSLVLAQGIGRWGNYINMEAYGLRIAEEALQFFPFAVEIPVGDVWYWHMATFFYEFCWDMVVFLLRLIIRRLEAAYRSITGRVMDRAAVARAAEDIEAIARDVGMRKMTETMMQMMVAPHGIRTRKGVPEPYVYIALQGIERLQPWIWLSGVVPTQRSAAQQLQQGLQAALYCKRRQTAVRRKGRIPHRHTERARQDTRHKVPVLQPDGVRPGEKTIRHE